MIAVALDFETAHHHRHAACQIALIRAEDGRVTRTLCTLLDPTAEPNAQATLRLTFALDALQAAPALACTAPTRVLRRAA